MQGASLCLAWLMKEPNNLHLPDVQALISGELTSLRVPALHRAWDVGLRAGGILTPFASVPRGSTRPQQLCWKADVGHGTVLVFWQRWLRLCGSVHGQAGWLCCQQPSRPPAPPPFHSLSGHFSPSSSGFIAIWVISQSFTEKLKLANVFQASKSTSLQ